MPDNHKNHLPHLVLVPIARPDTAERLLQLALSLAASEEGEVIALTIAEGEGEAKTKTTEALEPLIEKFQQAGHNVQLMTELANSVSRGILDAARERGADLLVMGVQHPKRQEVKLGAVVDNCVLAAPCDVIIYRISDSPRYQRIFLPIDYGHYQTAAVRLAAQLAQRHQIPLRLYIQRSYIFPTENEAELDKHLSDLPPYLVEKVYPSYGVTRRILRESGPEDLIVLGFSQKKELSQQIINGSLEHQLLNRAEGPVIMVSEVARKETLGGFLQRQYYRWNPTMTKVEQSEVIWQGQKSAEPTLDYLMMIVLSAGLATFGLLANSPAVIIGAMLVAPLMQPLAALAIGLVRAQIPLVQRALTTLTQGVMLALLLAITLGRLLPIEAPTSEMLARGTPSLLDAGVALVSGLVAAYATSRKDIPAALAGVAIAAALMPPVCTIGLGIAIQDAALAGGAFLLFLTNIAFIVGAESLIFLWMGLRPPRREAASRWTALWWAGLAATIALVIAVLFNLNLRAQEESATYARLTDIFAPSQVVSIDKRRTNPLEVVVTIRAGQPIAAEQIARADALLRDTFGADTHLEIIQWEALSAADLATARLVELVERQLPNVQVLDLSLQDAVVRVQLQSDDRIPSDALAALARAMESELGYAVGLQLNVVPVTRLWYNPPTATPPAQSD